MKTKDLLIFARSSRNFDAASDATFEEEHTPTTTTPTRICAYSRCKCKIDLSEGFRKSQTKRMRLCEEYASFASYFWKTLKSRWLRKNLILNFESWQYF